MLDHLFRRHPWTWFLSIPLTLAVIYTPVWIIAVAYGIRFNY